ncbi:carboxylating nicotinate-nucleotide diphosphorylase [Parvularcula sp. ZS-1/3]|uniref:Probable nicotinate-nucleotide pyrophosphorylase [carboxylating] n=1 Tax=Parvularcula mediterranea TaxID=2732508 RepID=A0A7Y3RJR7_9PROT|nr:carboxylating nicotinate-nucleotide diphosphorylase [Parvularcula mediterranea]NNU15343.1 carboxylating nicotinate-nucleotide diphosphorylase [Parvularcula mediterranea]
MRLPDEMMRPLIREALAEDLAQGGDLTTMATISPEEPGTAHLNARADGIAAGIDAAVLAFAMVDASLKVTQRIEDGQRFRAGDALLTVEGSAASLLTGERTALNLLTHLCGIAQLTDQYVQAVKGTKARIAATRKTLPGLRLLQKHAARCGGGMTHRMSLSDAVMIKDNHIVASGGLAQSVERAREFAGHTVKIEIEVDTLEQLREVLPAKPDIVLLDNMSTDQLKEAVTIASGQTILEASGGVTLETVRGIAETGVDVISVGALTHSAPALDIGMELSSPRR